MSDMIEITPREPEIRGVRLHHAYRASVTLRNLTRNALELTVRAGSPERWAVAPASIFLEAGRVMKVDLRLKLVREMRPRRQAGGAGRVGADAADAATQRDVFHVKTEYGEQRFHAAFTMATKEEIAAIEAREKDKGPGYHHDEEERARSASPLPTSRGGGGDDAAAAAASADADRRARFASAPPTSRRGAERYDDDDDDDDDDERHRAGGGGGRGRALTRDRPPFSHHHQSRHSESARITKKKVDALTRRLSSLEDALSLKDALLADKEELVRALRSRAELARERDGTDEENGDASTSSPPEALAAARATAAELQGANAALRGRCQELDGEVNATRTECDALKARLDALQGTRAPQLADLVSAAIAHERTAFEAQSLKALRVLEAKDAVLASREREVKEARSELGALASTLASARKELDARERRLISTIDELSDAREALESANRKIATADDARRALEEKTNVMEDDVRRASTTSKRCAALEETNAFLQAEAGAARDALRAAKEETDALKISLREAIRARDDERIKLTSQIEALEKEKLAMESASLLDGARKTAELARAHVDLASALDGKRASKAVEPAPWPPPPRANEDAASYLARSAVAANGAVPGAEMARAAADDGSSDGSAAAAAFIPPTKAFHVTPALVSSSAPEKVVAEVKKLQKERDGAFAAIDAARAELAEAKAFARGAKASLVAAAARAASGAVVDAAGEGEEPPAPSSWVDAGRHAAEMASMELHAAELASEARLREGDLRRRAAQAEADHAAETESLRAELAALRDRLSVDVRVARMDQSAAAGGERQSAAALAHRARTAEAEVAATRARAEELEAALALASASAKSAPSPSVAKKSTPASGKTQTQTPPSKPPPAIATVESRLASRVSELASRAEAADDRVLRLEDELRAAGVPVPPPGASRGRSSSVSTSGAAAGAGAGAATSHARARESAKDDARRSEAATSALRAKLGDAARDVTTAEQRLARERVRWENERARLESKLRATRDDGSVKAQALEATINALRSRSGLHAEVARLGDEATALRRAESRLRHELSFAEERLGAALLELKRLKGGYGHDDDQPDDALAIGAAAAAAAAAEGALERAQDRVVTLEKDAVRDRAEIRRLREELERVELERGRESSARADASVELAAALERCAARDRALHNARESAALEKERAAANRAHEVTAATRRSAAAESRASEADARAAAAREEARDARGECARKIAAADAKRATAQRELDAVAERVASAEAERDAARREREKLAAAVDERGAQLHILTETVEALQAAAGSGDREQRIVTLAAQAATSRASEAALERRCAELVDASRAHASERAAAERRILASERAVVAAEASAREAIAREELARQEAAATRASETSRAEELATLARKCDALHEARVAAESREQSARKALEAQHARHLEQLSAEREACADRVRAVEMNAARAISMAMTSGGGGGGRPGVSERDAGKAATMDAEDADLAFADAAAARERIERSLDDIVDVAKTRAAFYRAALNRAAKQGVVVDDKAKRTTGGGDGKAKAKKGGKENAPGAAVAPPPGDTADTAETAAAAADPYGDNEWSAAVVARLRALVLEAEREVGRAMCAARCAAAGETAANARAAAAEAALDARTAAWEEATAAATAAEERLARRDHVVTHCVDERLRLSRRRAAQLSESLAAAGRRLIAAEAATVAATRAARAETARAEAALRRARAAERDAAGAAADAAASREELAGAPSASDATEDVKAYFESEVVKSLLMGGEYGLGSELTGAAHHVAVARAAAGDNKDARLIGVTRELCAAKLTERHLLASLAAARRRGDASAVRCAELKAALDETERRATELERGGGLGLGRETTTTTGAGAGAGASAESSVPASVDGVECLAAQLASKAHDAFVAQEDVLRLRQRIAELELEVADLAGAREAAAAAATAAREGARADVAAAAARDAEAFAARAAALRRDLEHEKATSHAAVREAQAMAQKTRAEAAVAVAAATERADDAERRGDVAEARGAGEARAVVEDEILALEASRARAEARAGKAEARAAEATARCDALEDEVKLKNDAVESLRKAFATLEREVGGGGGNATTKISASAKKSTTKSPDAAAGGAVGTAQTTLGRKLVEAKLAEADAQRKLRAAQRAETELRDIVAKRDQRVEALKRQLVEKNKRIRDARWAAPQPAVKTAIIKTARAEAATREAREAKDAAARAAAKEATRGAGDDDDDDDDASDAGAGAGSGDEFDRARFESERAKLRAERSRAEAEVARLTAELRAHVASAPTTEEMEALQGEVLALRRAAAATKKFTSVSDPHELQADVNAAVVAAAAALGSAAQSHNASSRARAAAAAAETPPKPGSAAAAVASLARALDEQRRLAAKARVDEAAAKRTLRESGKEKAAAIAEETAQRAVVRELTQRASALGRDKAELVDERDKLKERLRATRASHGGRGAGRAAADASAQCGEGQGDVRLVDARALASLLSQQLDGGFTPASAFVSDRARTDADAETARVANALSVETAALRAVVSALASDEHDRCTPTELVTRAATAAMAAMPSAPLVHTVSPSVVATAMAVAPLAAERAVAGAGGGASFAPPPPVAAAAAHDKGTDVDGLRPLCVDAATEARAMTTETRSGPDPGGVGSTTAPRDASTSPGGEAKMVDGTGRRAYYISRVDTATSGCDAIALTFDAGVSTELQGDAAANLTTLAEIGERRGKEVASLEKRLAAASEKWKKWKARCDGLKSELATSTERAAALERAASGDVRLGHADYHYAETASDRDAPAAAYAARRRVAELEALLSSVDGAGAAAATAARADADAAVARLRAAEDETRVLVDERDRLKRELDERDDEHARMIAAMRSTIRGMRNASPADRAAYLEALRLHAESGVGSSKGPSSSNPNPNPTPRDPKPSAHASKDAAALVVKGVKMAERVVDAERRMEKAFAVTAAALDAAETGAAAFGSRASEQAAALATRVDDARDAIALVAKKAEQLEAEAKHGEIAAAAATRWRHVARCERYRELLRKLREEHEEELARASAALDAARLEVEAARAEALEARGKAERAANMRPSGDDAAATEAYKASKETQLDGLRAEIARLQAHVETQTRELRATNAKLADAEAATKASRDASKPTKPEASKPTKPEASKPEASKPKPYAPAYDAASLTVAAEASDLLERFFALESNADKIALLESRLATKADAAAAASRAEVAAEDRRRKAESRCVALKLRISELEQKVNDPSANWDAFADLREKLSESEEKLKRARADVKRMQALAGAARAQTEDFKKEKSRRVELHAQLAEAKAKAKELKHELQRKDAFARELKSKLESAGVAFSGRGAAAAEEAAATEEARQKLARLRAEAARKDALIAKLRGDGGDVDDKVATAVASAIAEEQQRAAESSKRMKRELQRKDEALKAHEGRVQTLRDELERHHGATAAAEKATARAWAIGGYDARRAKAMLSGVRRLSSRLLRLSAAVGHTVGAASKASDALEHKNAPGPVERGIARLVDMEPDEVKTLLDGDDPANANANADADGSPPSPVGGRAAHPASFASLIRAMDARALEVERSLSFPDASSKRASVGEEEGDGSPPPPSAPATVHVRDDAQQQKWNADALRWIVEAAEAEAAHAEAALKAAVPAMQAWWINVLATRNGLPGAPQGAPGDGARFTRARGSARKREEARRRGDARGVREHWPAGEFGAGTREKLAGAAALLASSSGSDEEPHAAPRE